MPFKKIAENLETAATILSNESFDQEKIKKDLTSIKESIDKTPWLTDDEKKELLLRLDLLQNFVEEKIDKTTTNTTNSLKEYQKEVKDWIDDIFAHDDIFHELFNDNLKWLDEKSKDSKSYKKLENSANGILHSKYIVYKHWSKNITYTKWAENDNIRKWKKEIIFFDSSDAWFWFSVKFDNKALIYDIDNKLNDEKNEMIEDTWNGIVLLRKGN